MSKPPRAGLPTDILAVVVHMLDAGYTIPKIVQHLERGYAEWEVVVESIHFLTIRRGDAALRMRISAAYTRLGLVIDVEDRL